GRRLIDQQQIADEIAFGEAFRLALRESLAVLPGHTALLAAYLRLPGKSVESLEELLLRCARAGATIGPRHDPLRVAAAARALRDELAKYPSGLAMVGTIPKLHAGTRTALVKRFDELAA